MLSLAVPLKCDRKSNGRRRETCCSPDSELDTHCVRCHGENGGGDGPDAGVSSAACQFSRDKVSYPGAADVIHDGVPGSGMPAWPLLTPPEIQAMTYYMRSLYQGPARRVCEPDHGEICAHGGYAMIVWMIGIITFV